MSRYWKQRGRRKVAHDYFSEYKSIDARFESESTCGHKITKGERIGWNPLNGNTKCAACWKAWYDSEREIDRLNRLDSIYR
jgi:hypothetical protein